MADLGKSKSYCFPLVMGIISFLAFAAHIC